MKSDKTQTGIGIIWDFSVKHGMVYHDLLAAVCIEHQLDKLKKEIKDKKKLRLRKEKSNARV